MMGIFKFSGNQLQSMMHCEVTDGLTTWNAFSMMATHQSYFQRMHVSLSSHGRTVNIIQSKHMPIRCTANNADA